MLMYESASNVWISLDLSFFSNMAAYQGGFELALAWKTVFFGNFESF